MGANLAVLWRSLLDNSPGEDRKNSTRGVRGEILGWGGQRVCQKTSGQQTYKYGPMLKPGEDRRNSRSMRRDTGMGWTKSMPEEKWSTNIQMRADDRVRRRQKKYQEYEERYWHGVDKEYVRQVVTKHRNKSQTNNKNK